MDRHFRGNKLWPLVKVLGKALKSVADTATDDPVRQVAQEAFSRATADVRAAFNEAVLHPSPLPTRVPALHSVLTRTQHHRGLVYKALSDGGLFYAGELCVTCLFLLYLFVLILGYSCDTLVYVWFISFFLFRCQRCVEGNILHARCVARGRHSHFRHPDKGRLLRFRRHPEGHERPVPHWRGVLRDQGDGDAH